MIFDIQLRQLEGTGTTAYTLLTAATLSAALAAPLLVSGIEASLAAWVFGCMLIAYLGALGIAVYLALKVLFTRTGHDPTTRGIVHYKRLRHLGVDGISRTLSTSGDQQLLRALCEDIFILARVVDEKATALGMAIRWAGATFALLGLAIVTRFAVSLVD